MDEELKPCPFCGSHNIITHFEDAQCTKNILCILICDDCRAEIHSTWQEDGHEAKKEAIKRWNKRSGEIKLLFKDERGIIRNFEEWYRQQIIAASWGEIYDDNDFEFNVNKEAQKLMQAAMVEPDDEGVKVISWKLEDLLLKHSESLRDRVLEILNLKSHNEYLNERRRALEELKDCPRCGRHSLTITVLKTDKDGYNGVITCNNCGTSIRYLKDYDTPQEAKEQAAFKWNKREGKEND